MDGDHVSPATNDAAESAAREPAHPLSAATAGHQAWTAEVRRLKDTLRRVVAECRALQDELKRAELEKAVLVEKLKVLEQRRVEVEPLQAKVHELTNRVEQDRLLIDLLQVEFRQAILERAQVHKDLFDAHAAVDRLCTVLDSSDAPVPPVEPN